MGTKGGVVRAPQPTLCPRKRPSREYQGPATRTKCPVDLAAAGGRGVSLPIAIVVSRGDVNYLDRMAKLKAGFAAEQPYTALPAR
jgi:hypothetical protein